MQKRNKTYKVLRDKPEGIIPLGRYKILKLSLKYA
jgi:hypothetical protein